jgi:hypothetical protein
MAVTAADFLEVFPEFATASASLVQGVLDREAAAAEGVEDTPTQDDLIMYSAADRLARSPFARDLKLMQSNHDTVYSAMRRKLLTRATIHRRFAAS